MAGGAGAAFGELGAEWTHNADLGRIIGSGAGFILSDGDAEPVNIANLMASNAIENNHLAFKIYPNAAGGNGHMEGYFQDADGNWYVYNQGTPENASAIDALLNKGFKELITIVNIGQQPYDFLRSDPNVVYIETTKDQDAGISYRAFDVMSLSKYRQYHLWTNNCVQSFVGVCGAGGVNLPDIGIIPRPNSYFDILKKQYPNNYTNKGYGK